MKKAPTVVIYIIGLAGTGKYTISKHLQKIGASFNFKLIHNHHINNIIFNLMDLDGKTPLAEEVWAAVRQVRSIVLSFLSTYHVMANLIFTNQLVDSNPYDYFIYEQIKECAAKRNSLFVPVLLSIIPEEHVKRITTPEREILLKTTNMDFALNPKKLVEVDHPNLLRLDVSELSPGAAAQKILAYVRAIQ